MGFKTGGQQAPATGYSAIRYVNGKCGSTGIMSCNATTLYGTTTTTPPVINFTINAMTTTSITYTITSITNSDGTSVTYPYTFPTPNTCGAVVDLNAINNSSSSSTSSPSFYFPTTIQTNNKQVTTTFSYVSNNKTTLSVGNSYNVTLAYWNSPYCPTYSLNNSIPATSTSPAISNTYQVTLTS
jgi:hypothetical protein